VLLFRERKAKRKHGHPKDNTASLCIFDQAFLFENPSIFALESVLQPGWYVPSSEENPVSEAIFRALERTLQIR
jgi:hypothetical protein